MEFSILISTMNRSDLGFLDKMFPEHDINTLSLVIINQTTPKNKLATLLENIKIINSFETGLSKSRNLAIENCSTKFGLIADDDLIYKAGFEVDIEKSIANYATAGLIVFQLENENNKAFKDYKNYSYELKTTKQLQNISSAEMLVNTELIKENNLAFDTRFGINAVFPMGEEQVFSRQLINKRIKIQSVNLTIAQHHGKSSGQNPNSDAFIKTALAIRIPYLKKLIYLWMVKYILFLWRKKHIQFNEFRITFRRMNQQLNFVKKHLKK